jgi:hypothetical protein
MLPNGERGVVREIRGRAHFVLVTLLTVALVAAIVTALCSSGRKAVAVQAAQQRLETAEFERQAAAAHAAVVVRHAAEARAATRPALGRVELLRSRVTVERADQLRVRETDAAEARLVDVPPLVTERMQADSAAISALSVALTWDSRAAAALEERLVAETKAREAARVTIAALERERKPRCGRRCGMVLGAASIVALGIAVDQTRRMLR